MLPADLTVHPFAPGADVSGHDEIFAELTLLTNAIVAENWGTDDYTMTESLMRQAWRSTEYTRLEGWLVRDTAGAIVAWASLSAPLVDNTHLAHANVRVVAARRGEGLGRAVLALVEERAAELGRTVLLAYTVHPAPADALENPGSEPAEDARSRFAARAGYTTAQLSRCSLLDLDAALGDDHPDARAAVAGPLAAGYELVRWQGPCPDDLLDQYAELYRRMSTDIPLGDLAMEEEVWDAARVRTWEQEQRDRGATTWVTAARHRETGVLAAFTLLVHLPSHPEKAEQEDTLVITEHRGKGLGLAVKLANLAWMRELRPGIRRIYTWNASENRHMLAINLRMGFRPFRVSRELQKRFG